MKTIIKVDNLCKEFKIYKRENENSGIIRSLLKREYTIKKAIKNINFNIGEGEIVGYLGPNGAGKSTTIKILSGILAPTSGIIEVDGIDPSKDRIENASKIGVVFGQKTQLWWDIPVIESINLMKYMYNIPDKVFDENLKIFREILDLDEFINIPVRQLSLGQRMRADLCCALIHNPKIIFLDEPTIGLDIVAKKRIQEFIKEINTVKKVTVILTTHDIDDIEKLCDRVIVIDKGEVLYNGNLRTLKKHYSKTGTITFEVTDFNMQDIEKIHKKDGILEVSTDKDNIKCVYDKSKLSSSIIAKEMLNNYDVKDIICTDDNLDDIIRKLYSEGVR